MLGDLERPHDHPDSQGPGTGDAGTRGIRRRAFRKPRSPTPRSAPKTMRSNASRRSPGRPTARAAKRRSHARPGRGLSPTLTTSSRSTGSRPRTASMPPRAPGPTRRRRSRVLLICGSARNDGTCPGEISKSWRLVQLAREVLQQADIDPDLLDLSRLTSEYGRRIHPCKGCVSTAMPLCHWPCSCYPNHALNQIARLDDRDLRALGRRRTRSSSSRRCTGTRVRAR